MRISGTADTNSIILTAVKKTSKEPYYISTVSLIFTFSISWLHPPSNLKLTAIENLSLWSAWTAHLLVHEPKVVRRQHNIAMGIHIHSIHHLPSGRTLQHEIQSTMRKVRERTSENPQGQHVALQFDCIVKAPGISTSKIMARVGIAFLQKRIIHRIHLHSNHQGSNPRAWMTLQSPNQYNRLYHLKMTCRSYHHCQGEICKATGQTSALDGLVHSPLHWQSIPLTVTGRVILCRSSLDAVHEATV